ncbi:MAG: MFS transporter [Gammaproteobacteria bacterium]|nr:MFS transporter [Gammaproteobacteria bacterium]
MFATLKTVASLLLSYGLLLLANGLFSTLLGVRTTIEDFSTEIVGVIMAGYFLGLLLGARYSVRVVANVGHIRAFAAFASIMSVSALTHAMIIDPLAWFVMRVGSGFCMAGMIMVTESWLNERATNRNRGQILSIYMITNYAAAGCGQFLLPLADPGRFHLFSVISILFSLALVPVLLTRAEAPQPIEPHPISLRELYRTSPFGLLGAFGAGLVNATFYGMGPVFTQQIGFSLADTSLFMSSVILAGLVLQWPIGRLSDRVDRRYILIGVALGTSVTCVAIAMTAGTTPPLVLFVLGAVYGSLAFTIYSLAAAHTNDRADAARLVQTASGLLLAYGFGAVLGPMLAAAIMGLAGPQSMFIYSAVVMAAIGGFGLLRMRQRHTEKPRRRFVPVPHTQYSSRQLYNAARDQMDRDLAGLSGGRRRRD